MEISEIQEKYGPVLKHFMLPIIFGVIGIALLLYGLISYVLSKDTNEVVFEAHSEGAGQTASDKKEDKQITVDIEGAVIKPGVYKLPLDARIQDGLIAAGGMSEGADRVKVAKGMNLAGKLVDGGKIYIPFLGDTTAVAQGGNTYSAGSTQAGQSVMGDSSALININSASSAELDSLSGVGPATAEKIIANRPYEKIEDLLSKKAVGQSVFGKIKDKISVY
jgi:competence protein ComEA